MQIKRFEAPDMQQALRRVKEVLGPEAIILSTKALKKTTGRAGAFSPGAVEVVAAIDHPPAEPARMPGKLASHWLAPAAKKKGPSSPHGEPFLEPMLSAGLASEFIHRLGEEFRAWLKESGQGRSAETLRSYLQWKLMDAVEVTGDEVGAGKVWSFIGPTGVGKTTTLAKLAAHFSLQLKKKVTLVTIDTYRIGAIDQLSTYSRILRLPLEIASGRGELDEILQRNRHQDLVLIDTAGRNPYQGDQLEELRDILAAERRMENHLVLSATTKDSDLAQIAERFSRIPIRSYIFTKIDETEDFSPLFNQVLRLKRPLSYLTNGQRVPEDIEPATKGRVANLVLNRIQWN
jgi:flagellar biosynthesis protein FlhF